MCFNKMYKTVTRTVFIVFVCCMIEMHTSRLKRDRCVTMSNWRWLQCNYLICGTAWYPTCCDWLYSLKLLERFNTTLSNWAWPNHNAGLHSKPYLSYLQPSPCYFIEIWTVDVPSKFRKFNEFLTSVRIWF